MQQQVEFASAIRALIMAASVWMCCGNALAATKSMLEVGAASKVINPKIGDWVQAAGVTLRATAIHDDLEANALYLSDGTTQLLFIGCDLVGLDGVAVSRTRDAISKATGIPARNVLISCTHTHGGPCLIRTNYQMPVNEDYLKQLTEWLVELSRDAVKSKRPGKVGWAKSTLQIGFNRRLCFASGSHTMYGDVTRPDFTGMEGPEDPQHLVISVADPAGNILCVVYHNTTHPTLFYGTGMFSSDFAGVTRKILRQRFGEIPVLYLNGAQGDIAIIDSVNPVKESRDQKLQRVGRLVADETLRLMADLKYQENPRLAHSYEDLKVTVRLPTPERVAEARKTLARIDAGESNLNMIMSFGVVNLQEMFGNNPVDTLPVHGVLIGDIALATQPCELYCQFGLDIKRRSPAPVTAVVGLTDGYCGYCPTIYGILGGGYSGEAINWTRLEANAGYLIVESASRLLNGLWRTNRPSTTPK